MQKDKKEKEHINNKRKKKESHTWTDCRKYISRVTTLYAYLVIFNSNSFKFSLHYKNK